MLKRTKLVTMGVVFLFKIYPLEIGDVKECMIEIKVHKGHVLGNFYIVADEEVEENNIEYRYHKVPFYSKEFKQTDYPHFDFIDWVILFCELCEEEQKR